MSQNIWYEIIAKEPKKFNNAYKIGQMSEDSRKTAEEMRAKLSRILKLIQPWDKTEYAKGRIRFSL